MSLVALAIFLGLLGLVLLGAELVVPLHGTTAVLSVGCWVAAVAVCFMIGTGTGAAVLLAALVLGPVIGVAFTAWWPRSPIAQRLVLPPTPQFAPEPFAASNVPPAGVVVGMTGSALTDLKPMGVCQFGDVRAEVVAERGLIGPGTAVRVVAMTNGKPTVRAVA